MNQEVLRELRKQIQGICYKLAVNAYNSGEPGLVDYAQECADELEKLISEHTAVVERQVAVNALAIAEYWIKEDGRAKHLIQDLWDVRNIAVLDHIDQKYIDKADAQFEALNSKEKEQV